MATMRTLARGALTGALLAALAGPVAAQEAKPGFTVTFSGEMRVLGFVFDNVLDFADTGKTNRALNCPTPGFPPAGGCSLFFPDCKDSGVYYFQRWQLFTTVESADPKARAVWG